VDLCCGAVVTPGRCWLVVVQSGLYRIVITSAWANDDVVSLVQQTALGHGLPGTVHGLAQQHRRRDRRGRAGLGCAGMWDGGGACSELYEFLFHSVVQCYCVNPSKSSTHFAHRFIYIQLELALAFSAGPAVAFYRTVCSCNCYTLWMASPPLLRAITAYLAAAKQTLSDTVMLELTFSLRAFCVCTGASKAPFSTANVCSVTCEVHRYTA
jgi:hypothetical protein